MLGLFWLAHFIVENTTSPGSRLPGPKQNMIKHLCYNNFAVCDNVNTSPYVATTLATTFNSISCSRKTVWYVVDEWKWTAAICSLHIHNIIYGKKQKEHREDIIADCLVTQRCPCQTHQMVPSVADWPIQARTFSRSHSVPVCYSNPPCKLPVLQCKHVQT